MKDNNTKKRNIIFEGMTIDKSKNIGKFTNQTEKMIADTIDHSEKNQYGN